MMRQLLDALLCALGRHAPEPARLADGRLTPVCRRCGLILLALVTLATGCASAPPARPDGSAPTDDGRVRLAHDITEVADVWRLTVGLRVVAVLAVLPDGTGRLSAPRPDGLVSLYDLPARDVARVRSALIEAGEAASLDVLRDALQAHPRPFLTRTA